MLGTGSTGPLGDIDRDDRLGLKKDVNLDEVFENEDVLPWGVVDGGEVVVVVVGRDWDVFDDLDAPFRTIPSIEEKKGLVMKQNGNQTDVSEKVSVERLT